jgi:hypothetical protein
MWLQFDLITKIPQFCRDKMKNVSVII